MSKPFYITTTLPYVNAEPHVGFAMEIVHADALARYMRFEGREVFFNTGTDEHGQKLLTEATKAGQDVKTYVDHFAEKFRTLKDLFGLSNDRFIRTTDVTHIAAARELWGRCVSKGDIYKKKYTGLYCVGDEMFLKSGDLVNGRCPNHPNMDPVEIEEENYFFRLSAYQEKLLQYLKQDGVILPAWRQQEAIKFVEGGLEDFSISREKSRMDWGISVPADETQVMYVWFDALTNYISTLNWPDPEGDFKKFWHDGEVIQMAGKDQIRFQSVMWQAMLMSADIKTTDKVIYHGFINSGGQKMSKSLGNVLSPFDIISLFEGVAGVLATDVLRYYLLRHVNTFDDSDVTVETVKEAYQAHLANGLGNLTSRILTLSENYCDPFEGLPDGALAPRVKEGIDAFDLQRAMNAIWEEIGTLDMVIQQSAPFKVVKVDLEEGKRMIEDLVSKLYTIAVALAPFLPTTSEMIIDLIRQNKKPEAPLFQRLS